MTSRFLNGLLAALCLVFVSSFSAFAKTEAECLYAVDYGTKQIEKDPADFRGYACRGTAYNDLKKYDLAERDLLKAISLKPDEEGLYVHLSVLYTETNRDEQALKSIRQAIALGSKKKATYNLELAILNSSNHVDECLKRSKQVVSQFPNDAMAYYYMALSKRKKGTYPKSVIISDLTKSLSLDAVNAPAIHELERVKSNYRPK